MKAKGQKTFVPEGKPKPKKRNIEKEKRDRMVSYGRKVTGFTPVDFGLKKPHPVKIDHDDI